MCNEEMVQEAVTAAQAEGLFLVGCARMRELCCRSTQISHNEGILLDDRVLDTVFERFISQL